MKKSLTLGMAVLLVLAWYVTVSSWLGNGTRYENCLAEAKRLEGKELYLDAITQYEEAMTLKSPTLEVELLIAEDYRAMGDSKGYTNKLNNIISAYGPEERAVTLLCDYYKENYSQERLMRALVSLREKYPDDKLVEEYYNTIKGLYREKYMSMQDIGEYHGKYAVYVQNGKKGLLDTNGDVVVEAVYDDIAYNGNNDDWITVKDGESYYFINKKGYKVQEPDESYEYLGILSQKRVVAKKAGKYGYLNENMKEQIAFVYDDATVFKEDLAAVKQGEKWALINRKGELKTEFIYDEVAINSIGACSVGGVVWVRQGDGWFLINDAGETIGTEVYDEVRAFETDGYCAVCKYERWGFVDQQGNLVIECNYQDAKSFANDFAPVKRGGLWGYIDTENYLAIACDFEDARQINNKMTAPVSHQGSWTLIELQAFR